MTTKQKISYIFLVFLILRLIFIFTFPPFVDELNYVLWGSSMLKESGQLFSSIQVWHKQPLPFWIFGAGSFLLADALAGARIINLLISVPSFFALYKLIKIFKNKQAALIGILIYSLCPVFIFFNSLVLIDGILLSLAVIILWVLFEYQKNPKLYYLVLLGGLLELTFWIKVTSVFLIILTFTGLLYILIKQHQVKSKAVKFLLIIALFAFLSLPLVKLKDFSLIFFEGQAFSFTFPELLGFPVLNWANNLAFVFLSLLIYLSPFVFLSIIFIYRELKKPMVIFLLSIFLLSVLSLILTSKQMRVRYFLFSLAPLLPLLGLGILNFLHYSKRYIKLRLAIIFLPLFIASSLLILSPVTFFSFFIKNSLLTPERDYVFDWPSGYGIKELNSFLVQTGKQNEFVLIVPATPNPLSSYLFLNSSNNPKIKLLAASIESKESLNDFKTILTQYPTTLFASSNKLIPALLSPHLEELRIFQKPGSEDYLGLYRVNFEDEKKE